jgi:hypothetical protein
MCTLFIAGFRMEYAAPISHSATAAGTGPLSLSKMQMGSVFLFVISALLLPARIYQPIRKRLRTGLTGLYSRPVQDYSLVITSKKSP